MINLHILNATGSLTPYLKTIEEIFEKTKTLIEKELPLKNTDVIIVDNKDMTIPEIGVGGHTYGPHLVVISLNSKFKEFEKSLKKIPESIAHEFHHASRWQTVGYGETLLEALITEGLADHFNLSITHEKPRPWSKALDKKQIDTLLQKAKKEFNSKEYSHTKWFFDKTGEIPYWTGYSLGYYLVERYLKSHPNETAASLYNTKAQEFVS